MAKGIKGFQGPRVPGFEGKTTISILLTIFLCGLHLSAFAQAMSPGEEFENALALFKKKEYAQAFDACQRLEAEFPQYPAKADVLFLKGQILQALQQWPEAAQAFSRAAEVHAILGDYALYFQGEAWKKAGERVKSIEAFQNLIARYPQSLTVPQAKLRMAEVYFESGDWAQTVEVLGNGVNGNQKKNLGGEILWLLGQAWEGLKQWPKAYQAYQDLWLKYPLHPNASNAKVRMDGLVKSKKEGAKKIAPEQLYRRALLFYSGRLYENAHREMEQIKGFPSRSYPASYKGERWIDDLYFHRAMTLFYLKKYVAAAEMFNLPVHHSKSDEMAEKSLYWRTRTLYRAGWKTEALNSLVLLQKSYPQSNYLDRGVQIKGFILEEKGEIEPALAVYGEFPAKFPQSSLRFAMMWHHGWLHYKERTFQEAIQAWDQLLASNPPSPWTEKGLYWKGRALQELGKRDEATAVLRHLGQNYPASFYTQMASGRDSYAIGGNNLRVLLEEQPLVSLSAPAPPPAGNDRLRLDRGKLLIKLGLMSQAVEELEAFDEGGRANPEGLRLEIARLYHEAGEYFRSATIVRRNFPLRPSAGAGGSSEKMLYLLAYPLGHIPRVNQYAQAYQLDPALLSAVILEESRFNPQALSPAGARGLMQIMPMTGKKIAKTVKVPDYADDLLYDPEMNIRLGSWYLASLMQEFGGREILALASYNAGPHVVREWVAQKGSNFREDDFVENIPYLETRNYVIRVITSARMYRSLYQSPRVGGPLLPQRENTSG